MENRVSPAIPCVHHEHVHASAAMAGCNTCSRLWRCKSRGKYQCAQRSVLLPLSLSRPLRVIYLLNKRSERQENLN